MGMGTQALGEVAIAGGGAALLTWAWIAIARRAGMQDDPGHRRLHAQRTPRGGGFALMLAWFAAVLANSTGRLPGVEDGIPRLLLGAGLFTAIGLWDDLAPMHPAFKFLLQVLVAALLFVPASNGLDAPVALLLGLGLVYFVNIWNFMDGSNGMIAIQSLLVALALALWPGQEAALRGLACLLAVACAGFLPFNFPRARVFLGDAGSFGLGAALFLLLLASCRAGAMQPWQALLLCTPMLLDSAFTLARRVLAGRRFWRAHREHLYQYAVRKGHSHARVALVYAGFTALAWLLALAGQGNQSAKVAVALLGLPWLAGIALCLGLRRRWLARPLRTGSHG